MTSPNVRRFLLLAAAAAAFWAGPLAGRLGPVAGSAVLVVLGVLLAIAASGAASAVTVAAGAAGAFASGVLVSASPALAGSVLLCLCYAERTWRVRSPLGRGAHLALAAAGGAVAAGLVAHFHGADLAVQGVLVVVSAVLAALPLLVEADDPLAHALDEIADEVPAPANRSLHEGAELCRTIDVAMLDKDDQRRATDTWRALLRLAQARLRLQRAPRPKSLRPKPTPEAVVDGDAKAGSDDHGLAVSRQLDRKIADHVAALALMYTASDEAHAAEMSLDDGAMRSVETRGESLEQVSRAIVEEAVAEEV